MIYLDFRARSDGIQKCWEDPRVVENRNLFTSIKNVHKKARGAINLIEYLTERRRFSFSVVRPLLLFGETVKETKMKI